MWSAKDASSLAAAIGTDRGWCGRLSAQEQARRRAAQQRVGARSASAPVGTPASNTPTSEAPAAAPDVPKPAAPTPDGEPDSTVSEATGAVIEQFSRYVIGNYTRLPVVLVRGEGSYVWDLDGRRYLDLFPGWGCGILGHCPPRVVSALQEQAARLIHVPNTWYMEAQGRLAQMLAERSFGGRCFFCNSGAESIEAAIKLARLHSPEGRYKIVSMLNSFHGRTLGAITATGQPKYHRGFAPLVAGFSYAPFNDLDAVRSEVDDETCAVLLELIQGEGGVNIATPAFVTGLRELCDENGLLLIVDEVQTGVGRTGQYFAYQHYGITPDIMVTAKGLAGGVAMGALMARPEVGASLKPGTHASTFGGNPIACRAAMATLETIDQDDLLMHVREAEAHLRRRLGTLEQELSIIEEVRIKGMMIGIGLEVEGKRFVSACRERGLLINCTHDTVLRLLPALNVTIEQLDEGCDILADVLREGHA